MTSEIQNNIMGYIMKNEPEEKMAICLRMRPSLLAKVDSLASKMGMSRSELIDLMVSSSINVDSTLITLLENSLVPVLDMIRAIRGQKGKKGVFQP